MKKFFRLFLMAFLLVSCHKTETPESFVDRIYILPNAPAGARITLGFESGSMRFFGESGVNRYFGIYVLRHNKLTLSPAGSTMMSGPTELMEAEQEYLQTLTKVTHFRMGGHKLYLYTADDKELVFNELSNLDNTDIPVTNRYLKKAIERRKDQ